MYKKYLKRGIDLLTAILMLSALLPLLLLLSLIITLYLGGNPFFIQQRTGKNGEIFSLIKFRSMHNIKDSTGTLLSDSKRTGTLGRLLRKTSLDELPQLINVLKGEMSLIGPRPLLPQYLSLYSKAEFERHRVKPGITGWAQVNGRNNITWAEKFRLDIYYVENYCFALDIKILWLTAIRLLSPQEIGSINTTETEFFKGNAY